MERRMREGKGREKEGRKRREKKRLSQETKWKEEKRRKKNEKSEGKVGGKEKEYLGMYYKEFLFSLKEWTEKWLS